jgi:hypothetical protein
LHAWRVSLCTVLGGHRHRQISPDRLHYGRRCPGCFWTSCTNKAKGRTVIGHTIRRRRRASTQTKLMKVLRAMEGNAPQLEATVLPLAKEKPRRACQARPWHIRHGTPSKAIGGTDILARLKAQAWHESTSREMMVGITRGLEGAVDQPGVRIKQ